MNYLKQVLAFSELKLLNPLSAGQISFWYALMEANNKCNWIEWFSISNSTLEQMSGLTRQHITNTRNKLKQLGLIDFKTNGQKATLYKINVLYSDSTLQPSLQGSLQGSLQPSLQDSLQPTLQLSLQDSLQGTCTLDKENKTKEKEIKQNNISSRSMSKNQKSKNDLLAPNPNEPGRLQEVLMFYEQNIGMPTSYIIDNLMYWVNDLNADLVVEALKRAVENGAKNYKYVEAILKDWAKKGYSKVEHLLEEQQAFEQIRIKQNTARYGSKKVISLTDSERQALHDVDRPISEDKKAKLMARL